MKRRKFPLIFVVEDDVFYANAIEKQLQNEHLTQIEVYHSGKTAVDNLYKIPEIVLLDHGLGDSDGLTILKQIKGLYPEIQVIFLSAQEELEVAINALKYGAYDYIDKGDDGLLKMASVVRRAFQLNYLLAENERYHFLSKITVPIVVLFILIVWSIIMLLQNGF
ncbi:MAG: DNA-binding NtrC family response regulator [Parvicellaceae bacterium]|jgi:DNA-binding NtrC family response regulator